MGIAIVVAATKTWGIGKNGQIPWRLKGDMLYFRNLTLCCDDPSGMNAVIMGRKTWESIPLKFRPLPGRMNVVVTQTPEMFRKRVAKHVKVACSVESAIALASSMPNVRKIFIIGGASIYEQAMALPECDEIFLTAINHDFDCDTYMPPINAAEFKQDPRYGKEVC